MGIHKSSLSDYHPWSWLSRWHETAEMDTVDSVERPVLAVCHHDKCLAAPMHSNSYPWSSVPEVSIHVRQILAFEPLGVV